MNYPSYIRNIIDYYRSLPGIGEKTAVRLAFATLELNDNSLKKFGNVISNINNMIELCPLCGNYIENGICTICDDSSRNHNLICVVEDVKKLISLEKTGVFKGVYHVLDGLISPIDNINPDSLKISELIKRVEGKDNVEVIIALNSSMEGDMTMLYIKDLLSKFNIKVTRLSYGIPLGLDFEYMDVISLNKALEDRREIDS